MKPTFEIDLDEDGAGALAAGDMLAQMAAAPESHAYRRALAIYNRSISRICEKVARAAAKLESRFAQEIALGFSKLSIRDEGDIIDHLELVLYCAAEHTDDLKAIAREVAGPRGENPKNAADRLDKLLKPARDRLSLLTNRIKHFQWRIMLLRQELSMARRRLFCTVFRSTASRLIESNSKGCHLIRHLSSQCRRCFGLCSNISFWHRNLSAAISASPSRAPAQMLGR